MNPNPFNSSMVTVYPKIKAWSYSAVSGHKQCPLRTRYAKIDRLPEPPNPAMARGTQLHRAFGAAVEHGIDQGLLAPEWYARSLELKARGAMSEKQLAFNAEWEPREWYAYDVWGRIIVDAIYEISPGIVQVIEFKSGKPYPDHAAQLRLYALAGFIMYPHATEARAENWYCDGPCSPMPGYVAQRSALPGLKQEFTAFAHDLLADDMFPARPGPHCSRCNFRKSGNGPCSHG